MSQTYFYFENEDRKFKSWLLKLVNKSNDCRYKSLFQHVFALRRCRWLLFLKQPCVLSVYYNNDTWQHITVSVQQTIKQDKQMKQLHLLFSRASWHLCPMFFPWKGSGVVWKYTYNIWRQMPVLFLKVGTVYWMSQTASNKIKQFTYDCQVIFLLWYF